MSFPFNAYLLAIAGAALATAASLPVWRTLCRRFGLVDDPGHRKIHDTPTPLAGGLAVLTGLVVPVVAGVLALHFGLFGPGDTEVYLNHGVDRRRLELGAIILGAILIVIVGVLDDRFELRPAYKFAGQLLVALLVAAAGVRLTLFVDSTLFSFLATVLWIVTLMNAFNFLDNMNGLCAGLGAIGAACFGCVAAASGQYLVATAAFLALGALLGFLPFNFPHASAFLGDAGSHLIGYLMSVLAILPHFYSREHPRPLAVLTPILVLAVPLADIAWVVLLRSRRGKPFYVGDNNHLSHQLERRGLGRATAVLLLWLAATLCGALSLAL